MLPGVPTNLISNCCQFSWCQIWVNSEKPQFVIWRVFFAGSALCTREGGWEQHQQAGAYFGCGFGSLSSSWKIWKRHLVQVTALLPSPGIVLRLPQVAPFHPRLFCIETHFPVFLLLLLRSCARSCQPGWWRPTVKGSGWSGGTQVSLVPLPPAASYLRRSSSTAASLRCSPGCITQNPLSGFPPSVERFSPQVGTLADWHADLVAGHLLLDNAEGDRTDRVKTGGSLSTNVSNYKCVFYQTTSAFNATAVFATNKATQLCFDKNADPSWSDQHLGVTLAGGQSEWWNSRNLWIISDPLSFFWIYSIGQSGWWNFKSPWIIYKTLFLWSSNMYLL